MAVLWVSNWGQERQEAHWAEGDPVPVGSSEEPRGDLMAIQSCLRLG